MYSPHQSSSFRIKQNTGMDLSPTKRSNIQSQSRESIVQTVIVNGSLRGEWSFPIGRVHLGVSFNCRSMPVLGSFRAQGCYCFLFKIIHIT